MSLSKISFWKLALLSTLAMTPLGQSATASFVNGTDSFYNGGRITNDTGNITTATTFTIGNFSEAVGNGTGTFDPVVDYNGNSFGTVTLTLNSSNMTATFSFGNAAYGTFTASTYEVQSSSRNGMNVTQDYALLGIFTPGTLFPSDYQGISQSASLLLGFTQNGSSNPSVSGTLSIPPDFSPVPEPASFAMLAIGLGGVFAVRRFRRRAA